MTSVVGDCVIFAPAVIDGYWPTREIGTTWTATLPSRRSSERMTPRVAMSSAALAFQKSMTTTLPARMSRRTAPSRRGSAAAGFAGVAAALACGAEVAGVAAACGVSPTAAWTFAFAASAAAAAAFAFGITWVGASGVLDTETGWGRSATSQMTKRTTVAPSAMSTGRET